ncbi:MAG: hypothetical protein Q4E53_04020 [Eubacteriales bacterium]|nr:hypothetical protein [Eubacteriales bacterium]
MKQNTNLVSKLFGLFLFVAIVFLISFGNRSVVSYANTKEESIKNLPIKTMKEEEAGSKHSLEHARSYLSSKEERTLYDKLYRGLKNGKIEIEITNYGNEIIKNSFDALLYDHPEMFWLINGFDCYGNACSTTISPLLSVDEDQIPVLRRIFNRKVAKILSEMDPAWDDYQKVLYFHDYIVNHCVYDLDAEHEIEEARDEGFLVSDRVFISANAFGCLVNQLAVCEGYSEAMQVLCNAAGIKCIMVAGNGGTHEWNIVYLDGVPYQIDLTWDDPVQATQEETNSHQELLHDYCFLTDEEMYEDHDPETENLPVCNHKENSYYIREQKNR